MNNIHRKNVDYAKSIVMAASFIHASQQMPPDARMVVEYASRPFRRTSEDDEEQFPGCTSDCDLSWMSSGDHDDMHDFCSSDCFADCPSCFSDLVDGSVCHDAGFSYSYDELEYFCEDDICDAFFVEGLSLIHI